MEQDRKPQVITHIKILRPLEYPSFVSWLIRSGAKTSLPSALVDVDHHEVDIQNVLGSRLNYNTCKGQLSVNLLTLLFGGRRPGSVVATACLESRWSWARAPLWPISFKETKCFFPAHSQKVNIVGSICDREVACLMRIRPPGLEFRILYLEDIVISIISPSSGGSPGPV